MTDKKIKVDVSCETDIRVGLLDRALYRQAGFLMEDVVTELQVVVKKMLNRKDNRTGDNPSVPGEPPAKVTGNLGRSWTTNARVSDPARNAYGLTITLASDTDYALPLETRYNRPYLKPSLWSADFQNGVTNSVRSFYIRLRNDIDAIGKEEV